MPDPQIVEVEWHYCNTAWMFFWTKQAKQLAEHLKHCPECKPPQPVSSTCAKERGGSTTSIDGKP